MNLSQSSNDMAGNYESFSSEMTSLGSEQGYNFGHNSQPCIAPKEIYVRKVRNSLSRTIKSVTIYREDIEKIEQIASDLSAKKFTICFGEFEYDSLKEIPENFPDLHKLKINFSTPYMSVEFDGLGARIYSTNENLEAMGAFESIVKIIERRSNKYRQTLIYATKIIGVSLFIVSVVVSINFLIKGRYSLASLMCILVFLIGYLIYYSYQHDIYKNSTVVFSNSSSRPSFIARYKDQIVVGLIIAIIGTVVGGLILAFLLRAD